MYLPIFVFTSSNKPKFKQQQQNIRNSINSHSNFNNDERFWARSKSKYLKKEAR